MWETDVYIFLLENDSLSRADVSVLVYADSRGGVAVMDDGRDVATVEGIETRGTEYLVLLLVKQSVIGSERGREIVDAMLDAGWYRASGTYSRIVRFAIFRARPTD